MKKGIFDFLTDPVVIQFVDVAKDIGIGIVGAWLYERAKQDRQNHIKSNIVLEFNPHKNVERCCPDGRKISSSRLREIERLCRKQKQAYKESLAVIPPDDNRPTPIYLEHTDKIVGWGHLERNDRGIKVADAEITDKTTAKQIDEGELVGFSIGGLVREGRCSSCNGDYALCNHISTYEYDGAICGVEIRQVDLADISIVKNPVQPLARITSWKGKPVSTAKVESDSYKGKPQKSAKSNRSR
jgi:hypothetical protein